MTETIAHPVRKPGQTHREWIEELAAFYDRTDTADLEGEEVLDPPFPTVDDMAEVVFRLPHGDLEILKRQAEGSGAHYSTLLRMIVQAHLRNPLTYQPDVRRPKGRSTLDSD